MGFTGQNLRDTIILHTNAPSGLVFNLDVFSIWDNTFASFENTRSTRFPFELTVTSMFVNIRSNTYTVADVTCSLTCATVDISTVIITFGVSGLFSNSTVALCAANSDISFHVDTTPAGAGTGFWQSINAVMQR